MLIILNEKHSLEKQFVGRMGNCIRSHNALNEGYLSAKDKIIFEEEHKQFVSQMRMLEQKIAEKYGLNFCEYKKITNKLYADMNESDQDCKLGGGSSMWLRLNEFISRFTEDITKIAGEKVKA